MSEGLHVRMSTCPKVYLFEGLLVRRFYYNTFINHVCDVKYKSYSRPAARPSINPWEEISQVFHKFFTHVLTSSGHFQKLCITLEPWPKALKFSLRQEFIFLLELWMCMHFFVTDLKNKMNDTWFKCRISEPSHMWTFRQVDLLTCGPS